jgi:hypothetical protein
MALKENNQPRKPSGPECESSKYTTKPTTTDGRAKAVLSSVIRAERPLKSTSANHAPLEMPSTHANKQAKPLKAKDSNTMCTNVSSKPSIICQAAEKLSKNMNYLKTSA